jgi:hypothetical protein
VFLCVVAGDRLHLIHKSRVRRVAESD